MPLSPGPGAQNNVRNFDSRITRIIIIVQALRGEPIIIYGDGFQTRSFCYVDDMIEAFIRFMSTDDSITGPMNLGNPQEFSIRELAEKVIDLTGSSSKLVFKQLPSDDPRQRQPDIGMARRTLNWEPATPLEKGLKKPSPISSIH